MQRPLVVGYPRTGFTLLINVISEIRRLAFMQAPDEVMEIFCAGAGAQVAGRIKQVFRRRGLEAELLYNGNFQELAGGPKWLKPEAPGTACFRKYIGVRGMGDFTLVTSHPSAVMDCYDVIHSHMAPAIWPTISRYEPFQKFMSLRDPAGALASACFSLNALASEYIQKFVDKRQDNDGLRQRLALYKLSDPNFFRALIAPLKRFLEGYTPVASSYVEMRWEDLISAPVPTIQRISASMNVKLESHQAAAIWAKLDHINLTGAHQHNLRRGHGKVGGWRQWLTNEHLAMMAEAGLFAAAVALGYPVPEKLDEAAYTPFQQEVASAMAEGRVIRAYEDDDLFGFAFNKSNIDWEAFGFRQYGWRAHTQIERSDFADEGLLMAVWDEAETACARVNEALAPWLTRRPGDGQEAALAMAAGVAPLFEDEPGWRAWRERLLVACQSAEPPLRNRLLLHTYVD